MVMVTTFSTQGCSANSYVVWHIFELFALIYVLVSEIHDIHSISHFPENWSVCSWQAHNLHWFNIDEPSIVRNFSLAARKPTCNRSTNVTHHDSLFASFGYYQLREIRHSISIIFEIIISFKRCPQVSIDVDRKCVFLLSSSMTHSCHRCTQRKPELLIYFFEVVYAQIDMQGSAGSSGFEYFTSRSISCLRISANLPIFYSFSIYWEDIAKRHRCRLVISQPLTWLFWFGEVTDTEESPAFSFPSKGTVAHEYRNFG